MVLLLLLLHLTLLAHASLAQSACTMNNLPAFSVGWSLPGHPTMPPSSDLVRLEYPFASQNLRFKCRKKTAVQRGSPSWIWQHGTEARTAGDAKAWWLCNQCWDKRKYDHLSIPAISAECERVFSNTKLTISPNRNRLKEDIIEATECLVQWTRAGW